MNDHRNYQTCAIQLPVYKGWRYRKLFLLLSLRWQRFLWDYAIEIDKFQLLWTVFGKVSGISEISLSEFPLHVLNIF